MSRYKQSPIPEFDDPVRAGDPFDEFNIEHDAFGRAFDLWEAPPPDDETFQRELRDALNRGLVALDPREEVWIRLYYGIPFPAGVRRSYVTPARSTFSSRVYRDNAQAVLREYPRTLEEIAEMSDCTKANVQKVIANGLEKLRRHGGNLRDVLHPELEESRRARAARLKLNKRRRARRTQNAKREVPVVPELTSPKKRAIRRPSRQVSTEPEDPTDAALSKLDLFGDLWIRLYFGMPLNNKRRYPDKERIFASYEPGYPRSFEEVSKIVRWNVDGVRYTINDRVEELKRRGFKFPPQLQALHPELELDKEAINPIKKRKRSNIVKTATYQILPKDRLPNYVCEPARAKSTRQRAVDHFRLLKRQSVYPYCAWHPYKQQDVVCGICGDDYLSKLEKYNPPVYFCYLCRKSVPVKDK